MVIWVLFHNDIDRISDIAVQKMEVVMEIEKRESVMNEARNGNNRDRSII